MKKRQRIMLKRGAYIFAVAFLIFLYYVYWGIHELVPLQPIDFIYIIGVLLLAEYLHKRLIEGK